MTTLNARANQAWNEYAEQNSEFMPERTQDAFEEGWETGYKAAAEEARIEAQRLTLTIQELARILSDEAEDTIDKNTKAKLERIAREVGGAS